MPVTIRALQEGECAKPIMELHKGEKMYKIMIIDISRKMANKILAKECVDGTIDFAMVRMWDEGDEHYNCCVLTSRAPKEIFDKIMLEMEEHAKENKYPVTYIHPEDVALAASIFSVANQGTDEYIR
jgi:hypothetical protein